MLWICLPVNFYLTLDDNQHITFTYRNLLFLMHIVSVFNHIVIFEFFLYWTFKCFGDGLKMCWILLLKLLLFVASDWHILLLLFWHYLANLAIRNLATRYLVRYILMKLAMWRVDMSSWSGMFVPAPVLRSLQELQFTSPTPIQALCLPPAIRDRLDIVAAAETVSYHDI